MNSGDQNGAASAGAGSAAGQDPQGQSGQGNVNVEELLREHENLKTAFGKQTNELGELRDFATAIEPLAKRLEANPALFDQIMSDKLNDEVVRAIAEGKISAKEGKEVIQAKNEVSKEVGASKLANMTPEQVSDLIEQKLAEKLPYAVEPKIEEFRTENKLVADAAEFIENTPDFAEYAEDVDKYLGAHPEMVDVSEAYYAVKGRALTQRQVQDNETKAAEAAKNVAIGANPGGTFGHRIPMRDAGTMDQLFGNQSSPTSLL